MKHNEKTQHSPLITPAAYARLRGLNRSTVSRQVRAGIISLKGGLLDPDTADAERAGKLDLGRQKKTRLAPAEPAPVQLTVGAVVRRLYGSLAALDSVARALALTPMQRRVLHLAADAWLTSALGDAVDACGPGGPEVTFHGPKKLSEADLAESDRLVSLIEKTLGIPDSGSEVRA